MPNNPSPGRGGSRPGAGRPEGSTKQDPEKMRSIRLRDDVWLWFKAQGGAKWIRKLYEKSKNPSE